ncbi:HupE/UreJ family protein [soil metagenome]
MRASTRSTKRSVEVKRLALALLLLVGLTVHPNADAHKASDAYLQLSRDSTGLLVRWDIALRDLDAVLDLDRDSDRKLTWGEVRARLDDIQAYALARLVLQQGSCALKLSQPAAIEERIDGNYLVLQYHASCDSAAALTIDYRLFGEVDPTHRGLLRITTAAGEPPVLTSLDPTAGAVSVPWPGGSDQTSSASTASFFHDGIHHIVIGYDHVLFLICLLLPAVMQRRDGRWLPVTRWRDAIWPMLGTVTMFTIAHSITLALAGLKIVTLSPRIIEPGIALTIMVAALDNLYPVLRGRRKLFTFLFGLIHGFGFAGVLSELDLPVSGFVVALLEFNLGVEAGQLVIVTIALFVLMALRHWRRYPSVILHAGSAVAVLVAAIWFLERVTDTKWLPI